MENIESTIKQNSGLIQPVRIKVAKKPWYRQKGFWPLTLFALPPLIVLFVFNIIPLYGLILPFQNFNPMQGILGSEWIGFANFEFLFSSGTIFDITKNTIVMNLLFIAFNTIVGVGLAIFMMEASRGLVRLFQTMLFIPYLLSWVIISFVVLSFLQYDRGLLNKIMGFFGNKPVNWYADPSYWTSFLVVVEVWKIAGYATLLYYAGLMGLGVELYEAAAIDGAGKWSQIWHISIPGILPLIVIINVLALGRVFNGDLGLFYNVPLNQSMLYPATDVIDTWVFRSLTTLNDFGMSAAAGMYQAVCGFVLVLLTNLCVKKYDKDFALF